MLLTPDQRNEYYLMEAQRLGIHKPILAALYYCQQSPALSDGERGLGMMPIHQVTLDDLDTFGMQVQATAEAIDLLMEQLINQGWHGGDLWEVDQGRYSDRFLKVIADGYTPHESQNGVGRLQSCSYQSLLQGYLEAIASDTQELSVISDFSQIEENLLQLLTKIPPYYLGLNYQREALLELVRIWRKLADHEQVIQSLVTEKANLDPSLTSAQIDQQLKQFVTHLREYYGGYPHQREALLRFTQLWRRLATREDAIASLVNQSSPQTDLSFLDPVLIMFVQHIPFYYEGTGKQRNALTEGISLWRNLNSRSAVLNSLGLNLDLLTLQKDPQSVKNTALQIDQELIKFIKRIPVAYEETDQQRQALLRLVQLWRGLPTAKATIESLTEDLKSVENNTYSPELKPLPLSLPPRPDHWTPYNIQISATIIPDGNFTWAEATKGGTRMPPNQKTVDAIIKIAHLAQKARELIAQPLIIVTWYRPAHINRAEGGNKYSRHLMGDAIDFICENLSGNQLYWTLDPWWTGGLGRYRQYPHICHIDARPDRTRWTN
jgi:hypothetical protein